MVSAEERKKIQQFSSNPTEVRLADALEAAEARAEKAEWELELSEKVRRDLHLGTDVLDGEMRAIQAMNVALRDEVDRLRGALQNIMENNTPRRSITRAEISMIADEALSSPVPATPSKKDIHVPSEYGACGSKHRTDNVMHTCTCKKGHDGWHLCMDCAVEWDSPVPW